jgi:hypothetical protein
MSLHGCGYSIGPGHPALITINSEICDGQTTTRLPIGCDMNTAIHKTGDSQSHRYF